MSFPQLDTLSQAFLGMNFSIEDSQFFMDTPIDPSMKKETDGGIIITRRQYTRDPGSHFVTGYTSLPHSHKQVLDYFYRSVGGGSDSFAYIHPIDNITFQVRFEEPPTMAYKGIQGFKVWDVTSIKLRTI